MDKEDLDWLNDLDEPDVTSKLQKMSAHQYIATPDKALITLSGEDITFLLDILQKVRKSMILTLADTKLNTSDKSDAIYIAEHSEDVYNTIIDQLKVSKANIDIVN